MKKLVLLGALALSVLSLQAFAADKPLKIGIEAAYPPFASKARRWQYRRFRLRHR
jgi:arginine/ornithine transport system substrate-binding protein